MRGGTFAVVAGGGRGRGGRGSGGEGFLLGGHRGDGGVVGVGGCGGNGRVSLARGEGGGGVALLAGHHGTVVGGVGRRGHTQLLVAVVGRAEGDVGEVVLHDEGAGGGGIRCCSGGGGGGGRGGGSSGCRCRCSWRISLELVLHAGDS